MTSRQLHVAALPSLLKKSDRTLSGCVVIDTLRFTTTATKALAAGCRSVMVVGSIEQARSLANDDPDAPRRLLCGERNCRRIEGFDFGNSPGEYTASSVGDRDLIFTTTNGTVAVQAASEFSHCLLGSLVNCTAIAKKIVESGATLWQLVCSGTDGEIAGEDLLAAGAIIDRLHELIGDDLQLLNDSARVTLEQWQNAKRRLDELSSILQGFSGGRQLANSGFHDDIDFACRIDLVDRVPVRRSSEPIFTL